MFFIQSFALRGSKGLNLVRWLGLLGLMGACGTALGAACPDAAGDNGRNDIPSHAGFTSSCALENASNTRYLILDNEYFPDGRRFMAMFPDEANMPGDANPVKFVFSPTSGNSLSTINAITCVGAPGAVITGVGTTLGEVALDDGTSCALTASSVVGGNTFIYTSTLLRNGAVYSSINADFSILDSIAPGVFSITRRSPSVSPTNADTLTWRVTFDENVQNVDATDFTRAGTGAGLAVTTVNASTYDVTLSGGDLANLNATVTLGFAGGQNISDTSGNALINTTPSGTNDNTFVVENNAEIDVQRPAGISIADGGTDAQGNQDAGTQVTLAYTVSNTGSTALSVTNIASTNPVNVNVDSILPTSFNVVAGATDTYAVRYTATAVGAFSFDLDISSNDVDEGNYDIAVSGIGTDSIPPSVEILDGPVSVANNDPFNITFEFSENVIGFTLGDITIGNGSVAGFVVLDSNTYTADITPDGNGDITIDVAASVAQDEANNDNTAAAQVVVTYGHIILPPAKGGSSGEDVGYTFAATEADGLTPVAATLSFAASTSKLRAPPEAANSLV
ncbi:Ig-like domain-containing protein, partial [Pseudomonadota bacterium]